MKFAARKHNIPEIRSERDFHKNFKHNFTIKSHTSSCFSLENITMFIIKTIYLYFEKILA